MEADGNARWFERAKRVTPGGVNSPVRAFNGVGGTPLIIHGGKGAQVFAADGRTLTDYCCSWGAMILGHANGEIVETLAKQAAQGTTFGIVTENEVLFAERLCSLVPGMEKVRAVNSGTEAVMSAVRLARGVTGRDLIVKFDGCYHGHSDSMLVKAGSGVLTAGTVSTASSAGVPADFARHTVSLPYNDSAAARDFFAVHGGEIAAVIVEPAAGNMGLVPPRDGFLPELRRLTQEAGALLICDEVITGFRFGLSSYSSLFAQIEPDLITLGKVIGGGLPLAAVGGKAAFMDQFAPDGPVYQAGTLSGNPLATAAGIATLKVLKDEPTLYSQIEATTTRLADGIDAAAKNAGVKAVVQHIGGMATIFFLGEEDDAVRDWPSADRCDRAKFAKFFWSMLDSGVYLPCSQFETMFTSVVHTDAIIDETVAAAEKAFRLL